MVSTASRTAETAAVAQVGGIPAALVATREAAVALEAAAASTAAMAVTVVVVRRAVAAAVRARAHAARVVVAARAQARAEVKMTSRTRVRNFGRVTWQAQRERRFESSWPRRGFAIVLARHHQTIRLVSRSRDSAHTRLPAQCQVYAVRT